MAVAHLSGFYFLFWLRRGVYRLITALTTGSSARCWRLSQRRLRWRREVIDSKAELLCDGTSNNPSADLTRMRRAAALEREGDWQRRVRNRSIPSSIAAAAAAAASSQLKRALVSLSTRRWKTPVVPMKTESSNADRRAKQQRFDMR